MNIASKICIRLIKGYKYLISPVLGKSCRLERAGSSFGMEAFSNHGFFHGFKLSFIRIIRCNPWGGYGYDPVPIKKKINN